MLAVPLVAMVFLRDMDALYLRLTTGEWPVGVMRLMSGGGKQYMSILCNMAVACLVAEALYRLRTGKRLLPLPWWFVGLGIIAAFFSNYLGMSRNGHIGMGLLLLSGFALFAVEHWRAVPIPLTWPAICCPGASGFLGWSRSTIPWCTKVRTARTRRGASPRGSNG